MKSETAEELPPSKLRRSQKAEGQLPRSGGSPRASRNLGPDEPGRDLCGKCTAGIDACPTETFAEHDLYLSHVDASILP